VDMTAREAATEMTSLSTKMSSLSKQFAFRVARGGITSDTLDMYRDLIETSRGQLARRIPVGELPQVSDEVSDALGVGQHHQPRCYRIGRSGSSR
jgi:hypothetical protein